MKNGTKKRIEHRMVGNVFIGSMYDRNGDSTHANVQPVNTAMRADDAYMFAGQSGRRYGMLAVSQERFQEHPPAWGLTEYDFGPGKFTGKDAEHPNGVIVEQQINGNIL